MLGNGGLLTKSKAAFLFNLERVMGDSADAFFWTFTFADVPDFPEVHRRWRWLLTQLDRHFGQSLYGVRVYELHETHGVHLHAVFNRYLRVEPVRALARRCGFGRIHVKRLPRQAADYLAKYLGKQHRTDWLKGKRLWACFGDFTHTRVKDVEVECDFTRAVKFCQQEFGQAKLPFIFINLLQRFGTTDPARLKLACAILKKSGPHCADLRLALRE